MSSWARWTVRVVLVFAGLLLASSFMAPALEAATALGVTTDRGARHTLQLAVVGGSLTSVGWIGVYVALTVGFRDGTGVKAMLTRSDAAPGGYASLERAKRQIDDGEPFREDEIAQLRPYAEHRVAQRRLSPAKWVGWIGWISVCAGMAIRPPLVHGDPMSATFTGQAFRVFYAVALLFAVALGVMMWRMRTDVKAEAFLRSTAPMS